MALLTDPAVFEEVSCYVGAGVYAGERSGLLGELPGSTGRALGAETARASVTESIAGETVVCRGEIVLGVASETVSVCCTAARGTGRVTSRAGAGSGVLVVIGRTGGATLLSGGVGVEPGEAELAVRCCCSRASLAVGRAGYKLNQPHLCNWTHPCRFRCHTRQCSVLGL